MKGNIAVVEDEEIVVEFLDNNDNTCIQEATQHEPDM